jgi:neutral ceramidase
MKTSTLFPGGWVGYLMLLLNPVVIHAAPLKAGLATVDITPPVGWRMSGYFYERLSTNIHDPLQAKALVFEQGREKAALVFCDLIGISRHLASQVRQTALRKTGIPAENILIAATHTHTGPLYFGALREHFHEAAVAKAKDGIDPFERLDYTGYLADRLVDVIVRAQGRLEPIHVEVGSANQTGLSFNRRYLMKDGSVMTNPGKTNSNILRAAGPVDPEVGILVFVNPVRKKPVATLTTFGLHPDTVGGRSTAQIIRFTWQALCKKL